MSRQTEAFIRSILELRPYLANADHIDCKQTIGATQVSLPAFVAGVFTYQPRWVTALFAIRWGFVRLLGMKQTGLAPQHQANPDDVPMTPGDKFSFLTAKAAEPGRYWVGGDDDKHLSFDVIAAIEPLNEREQRFHLMTIVRHNHWTGPLYFTVIKPFHHLIVQLAVNAAVKNAEKKPPHTPTAAQESL